MWLLMQSLPELAYYLILLFLSLSAMGFRPPDYIRIGVGFKEFDRKSSMSSFLRYCWDFSAKLSLSCVVLL